MATKTPKSMYEKNPTETNFSQAMAVHEPTYDYIDGVLNFIWFTCDGLALSIVQKLVEEGNNVIVAQVQDYADLGSDYQEEPETKRRRLSEYDGILEKEDAVQVLKKMRAIKNKADWIVWFDFNNMGPMAEACLKMGFTKGLFPTTEDTAFEQDRDMAKDIVRKHYPDLSVAEQHDFKSVDDALQFLEETDKCWVLKGNNENSKTIVPSNDDPALARTILTDALDAHRKDYESDGFILEEKLAGKEITPQCVWLDGKVVFTDIDFENKPIGAGNIGVQTGAMQTLVAPSSPSDKINRIAFPKWAHDQAKKHPGIYVMDAGILEKDGKYYFTEFCSQRFGYDSFFAEMIMAGDCTTFFEKLFAGKHPLSKPFGFATRGLNMHKDDKERRVLEGVSMSTDDWEHTFVYECKLEDDHPVSTGCGWDLVVFAGAGDTPNEAIAEAYKVAAKFAFEDMHIRPEFDMTSYDYPTSIPNRYASLNHSLFEAKEMMNHQRFLDQKRMHDIEDRITEALHEQG